MLRPVTMSAYLAVLLAGATTRLQAAAAVAFDVELDAGSAQQPSDGRLFVFLSQRDTGEPRLGPNWFRPEPFAGIDVKQFAGSRPGVATQERTAML